MTAPTITTTYSGRSTNWPALVLTVLFAAPLLLLAKSPDDPWWSWAIVFPLGLVTLMVLASVATASSLRALAGPRGVTVRFGVFGWPRFHYPIERIERAEVVDVPAVFWGCVVYWSPRRGLMLTLRPGPALGLVLTNGRRITVSTPDPAAAVRAIESARAVATRR